MDKLQQSAKYFIEYAGPMKPKPDNEVIQRDFNKLDKFPYDFKSGYHYIYDCMQECNHPDDDLFYSYTEADIHGGFFYDCQTSEERAEAMDQENYLYYMIVSLANLPSERFIPFENKIEWKKAIDVE